MFILQNVFFSNTSTPEIVYVEIFDTEEKAQRERKKSIEYAVANIYGCYDKADLGISDNGISRPDFKDLWFIFKVDNLSLRLH